MLTVDTLTRSQMIFKCKYLAVNRVRMQKRHARQITTTEDLVADFFLNKIVLLKCDIELTA